MATPFARSAAQIPAAPASAVNSCLSQLARPGSAGNCTTRPGQGGPPPKAHTYAGVGWRFHSGHKATLHVHKCSHSLVCHLLAMWSWSRSWEKAHGSLRKRLLEPGSHSQCLLCTSFWSWPGLAWAAEAWTSTTTAHGLVSAGAGEGSGSASPAVSSPDPLHTGLPSPSPSASVDSFVWRFGELTACGTGTQGMERRL